MYPADASLASLPTYGHQYFSNPHGWNPQTRTFPPPPAITNPLRAPNPHGAFNPHLASNSQYRGMQNPTTSSGNTQPYHASYFDLTNVCIASFHDPGHAASTLIQTLSTDVINLSAHVQTLSAQIRDISYENDELKRKVAELEGAQAEKSA
jgi:hypothetical protein